MIASYSYSGPDRIERRDFGNDVRLDMSYDEAGLPSVIRYGLVAGGAAMLTRSCAWDASGNCVQAQYGLDGRAAGYPTLPLRCCEPAGAVGAAFGPGARAGIIDISYTLDGASNRRVVSAGPDAGVYLLDPGTPEPADLQMNQYTASPGQPLRLRPKR